MRTTVIASLLLIAHGNAQERSPEKPLEFDGLIEAFQFVNLGAAVDGLLEAIEVERGDSIEKGQIVAVLESSMEKATMEIAKARVGMKGMLEKHKAHLDYSLSKYANDEKLHGEGILSRESLNLSRTEQELAAAGYLEAMENMQLAGLEEKLAEAALEQRIIRSPIDGVVVERFLSPGELVTRQNDAKIVAIAQVDPLRVEVILPAYMFGKVPVGMEAEVTTDLLPKRRFGAKVTIADRVIKAASNTFRVRLELPNPDNELPSGLRCRVRFLGKGQRSGR